MAGSMTVPGVVDRLGEFGVVPVVVINGAALAHGLGQALKAGGIPCAEVTLRTEAAEAALWTLAADPELLVGAGTVTRPEQVERAVVAGARFVVSPGFSASVVRECGIVGVPVVPGVVTATEVQMALDAGVTVLKFFPAEQSGGVAAVKALSAPYGDVRFLPTGGIGPANLAAYLTIPSVVAVGGSWLVAPELLARGDLAQVTTLTQEAVELVRRCRQASP
jgi:2-dehydro-3-deoxyphosphogluconate aldolase / (4S)-4-hydroxy-2-oxoglutarate aldolase